MEEQKPNDQTWNHYASQLMVLTVVAVTIIIAEAFVSSCNKRTREEMHPIQFEVTKVKE